MCNIYFYNREFLAYIVCNANRSLLYLLVNVQNYKINHAFCYKSHHLLLTASAKFEMLTERQFGFHVRLCHFYQIHVLGLLSSLSYT